MDALWIMFKNVLVFVALALPGFILIKSKIVTQEQSGVLSKILMYAGMPFLVLTSMPSSVTFNKELLSIMALVTVIAISYTAVAFFSTKPLTGMERQIKTRGMMRFSSTFSNNGFLGIPLAMAVFGTNSMVLTVVIIINIINNISLYTLGIYSISNDKSTISLKKAFLNPVLVAFMLGIVLNLLNVKEYVPEVVTFSTHFSNVVTPLSMTILGMKMGEIKFLELFKSWKVYYVSAIKLVLLPTVITAILFGLSFVFPIISNEIILGVFVSFAMPSSGLASTFADAYDGDTKSAVAFTLGTTILSITTIPILYGIINFIL